MVSFRGGTPGGSISPAPSTLYIPIASPPTPAPSPGPFTHDHDHNLTTQFPLVKQYQSFTHDPTLDFSSLDGQARLEYLNKIITQCTPKELSHISTLISPLLKRDFLQELPAELALHILSYIDDFYELVRSVGGVCKYWRRLSSDDWLWRRICQRWEFEVPLHLQPSENVVVPGSAKRHFKVRYLQRESPSHFPHRDPTLATNTHTHSLIAYIRNEMASRRNNAPQSPAADPTTRHRCGDVLGDGRELDRRRVIRHKDPRLQLSDGRVNSDIGRLSGRGLGRLVGRERVVVVTFPKEEEHEFGVGWVGAGNFVSCEWWM